MHNKPYQYSGLLYSLLAITVLAASLLLTGIPADTRDHIFAATHATKAQGNHTRPIDTIIVIGDAGNDTDDHQRAKLCGGNLWIDHLADFLGADLVSFAHGYAIRKTVIARNIRGMTRVERVKSPLARLGAIESIPEQVQRALDGDSEKTLHVIVADPSSANTTILLQAGNALIRGNVQRLLIVDTPTPMQQTPEDDSSLRLAQSLTTDTAAEIHSFSASRFLRQMQSEYYKYGLRFADHPSRQTRKGLGLSALSAVAFALMALLVRILSNHGIPTLHIMVSRCIIQSAISSLICLWRGISPLRITGGWKTLKWVLVRAVFGSAGHLLYYMALRRVAMGTATVLFFTNPVITALLARPILKEPFTKRHRLLSALCLAGIALVILPASPLLLFTIIDIGSLCALLGSVSVAFAYVGVRKAGPRVHPLVHVTYFGIIGMAGSLVLAAAMGEAYALPSTPFDALLVAGVGVTALLAQFLMNWGLQLAPAGPTVMMRNSDIVIAFILDAAVYRTVPRPSSIVGAAIITGCVVNMGLL
ncbi:hypothetical protein GGI20_003632 [Coemansia sp. BCRC 34301]|nr:hypothetical protein GGI20_003632 [Coemansia sp. BCRC 34301]